jgi:hypothetical protein
MASFGMKIEAKHSINFRDELAVVNFMQTVKKGFSSTHRSMSFTGKKETRLITPKSADDHRPIMYIITIEIPIAPWMLLWFPYRRLFYLMARIRLRRLGFKGTITYAGPEEALERIMLYGTD